MEQTPNQENLLAEFKATQDRINNFSTVRFSALGAGLTLMAIFISISKDASPIKQIVNSLIVPLLASATIRMVGSLNRGLYIFENQANWINNQLGTVGFSSVWPFYLPINSKDSGAHAFVVASRIVNLLSFLYVFINALYFVFTEANSAFLKIANWILIIYSIILYLLSEIYIRAKMNPKKIVAEIAINMVKAREQAVTALSSSDE